MAPGLYRGAQPSKEGLRTLKELGIRTVVNLRHYHGDTEMEECGKLGLHYIRFRLESSDAPSDEDVRSFLEIVTDPAHRPVYFHCHHGKDRTGTLCAAYRMAVEDWSDEALTNWTLSASTRRKALRAYVKGFPDRKDRIGTKNRA